MRLLLLGPPASGKGTLGAKLSSYFKIPLITVGNLLRSVTEDSLWYQPIHESMDKGFLVSPTISGGYLGELVSEEIYESGYVLDGWLRQLKDLEHFDPDPTFVLYLNISEEVSRLRMHSRLVCKDQGHTYNLLSKSPNIEGICDIDGSELTHRIDDVDAVLKKRLEVLHTKTSEVIKYYSAQNKVIKINAEPKPDIVFEEAKKLILKKQESMI